MHQFYVFICMTIFFPLSVVFIVVGKLVFYDQIEYCPDSYGLCNHKCFPIFHLLDNCTSETINCQTYIRYGRKVDFGKNFCTLPEYVGSAVFVQNPNMNGGIAMIVLGSIIL